MKGSCKRVSSRSSVGRFWIVAVGDDDMLAAFSEIPDVEETRLW
jgi:hypothetical protein